MASHSPLLITLMVVNLLSYLVNLLFTAMTLLDTQDIFGFDLFTNYTFGRTDKYIEITPAEETFGIWGPIYIWQAIWMAFGFACICRRAPDGPVYTNPVLLTPAFYCVSIINWILIDVWYYLANHDYDWQLFAVFALGFISIYICIGLSYKAIADNSGVLEGKTGSREVRLVRGIVHNGLALYATWCTIGTLLNLAQSLAYGEGPKYDQSTACTIALGILSLEVLLFFSLDWFVMDKYSRYTITPYIVIIVALAGSIAKNWKPEKRNSIFTAVLLGVGVVGLVVKVLLTITRHLRDARNRRVNLLGDMRM